MSELVKQKLAGRIFRMPAEIPARADILHAKNTLTLVLIERLRICYPETG